MSKLKQQGEVCPKCGGTLVMVQYSYDHKHHYDGVSEVACSEAMSVGGNCDYRRGRWCGEVLGPGEVEPRFHEGGHHPRVFDVPQDGDK